jgi:hypothetical protein
VQGVCGQSVYLDGQHSVERVLSTTGLSSTE